MLLLNALKLRLRKEPTNEEMIQLAAMVLLHKELQRGPVMLLKSDFDNLQRALDNPATWSIDLSAGAVYGDIVLTHNRAPQPHDHTHGGKRA